MELDSYCKAESHGVLNLLAFSIRPEILTSWIMLQLLTRQCEGGPTTKRRLSPALAHVVCQTCDTGKLHIDLASSRQFLVRVL